ncbi:MAG: hypothetical protein FJ042_02745 [Candidatus Cloacimonetes bacterium]|nr:hypothetical protein [Candidatus Cloacimonadota bacterium]
MPDKPQENDKKAKIGLVEIMLIMMLVGLVFVFIPPYFQMRADEAQEVIDRERFDLAMQTVRQIIEKAEEYKKTDEFGDYPILIEVLNVTAPDTTFFTYMLEAEDLSIRAISKTSFGKEGIKVIYSMPNKTYEIDDPAPKIKPVIKDSWLP